MVKRDKYYDASFNPWLGCSEISEGCKNCHAKKYEHWTYGDAQWRPQGRRHLTGQEQWERIRTLDRTAHKSGDKKLVLCGDMCDFFEENYAVEEVRATVLKMMADTPNLVWLILTKRPQNILRMAEAMPGNAWLGISAENQASYQDRMGHLLKACSQLGCKAFLLAEPLLAKITLFTPYVNGLELKRHLKWIVCGGEVTKMSRPTEESWITHLMVQSANAEIPFWFRRYGAWRKVHNVPDKILRQGWNSIQIGSRRLKTQVLSDGMYALRYSMQYQDLINGELHKFKPNF